MQVNKASLKGNRNSRSMNNKNNSMVHVFCLSDRSFGFYYFSHIYHLMYMLRSQKHTQIKVLQQYYCNGWLVLSSMEQCRGYISGKEVCAVHLLPCAVTHNGEEASREIFFTEKGRKGGNFCSQQSVCRVYTFGSYQRRSRAFTIAEVKIKWLH